MLGLASARGDAVDTADESGWRDSNPHVRLCRPMPIHSATPAVPHTLAGDNIGRKALLAIDQSVLAGGREDDGTIASARVWEGVVSGRPLCGDWDARCACRPIRLRR